MAIRERMVDRQIARRGVADPRVLTAMRSVPRHLFVPERSRDVAYADGPVSIGHGQTISQPYIVAFMTEQLRVEPGQKVLEVGTGSGYQAAVLAALGARVFSVEILPELSASADAALRDAGYAVHLRTGDGYRGWPEEAPFDRVIVTAAPDHVPQPLREQLTVGGRMVLPVGGYDHQELLVVDRTVSGYEEAHVLPVLFVPMTGEAQGR